MAATTLPFATDANEGSSAKEHSYTKAPKRIRKIATEEAFNIPEIADAIVDALKQGGTNLDLLLLKQIYASPHPSAPAASSQVNAVGDRDRAALSLLPKLLDLNEIRLADMNANSVDMHVLSLAMPGVQFFERDKASQLARLSNDRLIEAVRSNPKRFAGLASLRLKILAVRRKKCNARSMN